MSKVTSEKLMCVKVISGKVDVSKGHIGKADVTILYDYSFGKQAFQLLSYNIIKLLTQHDLLTLDI